MGTSTIVWFDGQNVGTTIPWTKLVSICPVGTAAHVVSWQVGNIVYVAKIE